MGCTIFLLKMVSCSRGPWAKERCDRIDARFSLQMLYIPLVIYVPALAFNQVTGINLHATAFLVCAVCIFYTTLVRSEIRSGADGR